MKAIFRRLSILAVIFAFATSAEAQSFYSSANSASYVTDASSLGATANLFDDFESYAIGTPVGNSFGTAFSGTGYQVWDTSTAMSPVIGQTYDWTDVNGSNRIEHWTAGYTTESMFFNVTQSNVLGVSMDVGGWGDWGHVSNIIVTTNLNTYTFDPNAAGDYAGYFGFLGFTTGSSNEYVTGFELRGSDYSNGNGEAIGVDNLRLDYSPVAVPEPSGGLLITAAGSAFLLRRRRRTA